MRSSEILSKSKISNFKNFEGFNNLSLNIKRDFLKKIKKKRDTHRKKMFYYVKEIDKSIILTPKDINKKIGDTIFERFSLFLSKNPHILNEKIDFAQMLRVHGRLIMDLLFQ